MDITDKKHALLGPSGAEGWGTCPGKPTLEEGFENTSSIYADNGTVMHEVAAFCLWDDALEEPHPEPLNAEAYVGRVFSLFSRETGEVTREIEFTMEFADIVNSYCEYVHAYVDLSKGDRLFVECEVPIDHTTGEDGATGTSDVIALCDNGTRLVVIDLKTGSGVLVTAEDNKQLGMYADGALVWLLKRGVDTSKIETVNGIIIQPPKNHASETTWTRDQLADMMFDLSEAAHRVAEARAERGTGVLRPAWADAYLQPSEKGCKFCRAKGICPALGKEALRSAAPSLASAFPNLDAEPAGLPKALAATLDSHADMDGERIGAILRSKNLIEVWLKGVEEEAHRRLRAGQPVTGYGLFLGTGGHRFYRDAAEVEKLLKGARYKDDDIYGERKLLSPAQAEKLVKKDKPRVWSKIEELIGKPEGQPVLDREDCGKMRFDPPKPSADAFSNLDVDDDPLFQ